MNTEILLSRGETVTTFELPEAGAVKLTWPEPKILKIIVPAGSKIGSLKSSVVTGFKEILNDELWSHLDGAWPLDPNLEIAKQSVALEPWGDVHVEILPKKAPRVQPEIALDRPRITIQMGQRVDEFSDNCKNHLKPELFEHVIRLWSDPDYCRTVLPVGRNLLIRGCV
ncbi:MAG: hypothetical protein RJA75_360 [Actinomycetota bacterium]|jgi:hypothetical protein